MVSLTTSLKETYLRTRWDAASGKNTLNDTASNYEWEARCLSCSMITTHSEAVCQALPHHSGFLCSREICYFESTCRHLGMRSGTNNITAGFQHCNTVKRLCWQNETSGGKNKSTSECLITDVCQNQQSCCVLVIKRLWCEAVGFHTQHHCAVTHTHMNLWITLCNCFLSVTPLIIHSSSNPPSSFLQKHLGLSWGCSYITQLRSSR